MPANSNIVLSSADKTRAIVTQQSTSQSDNNVLVASVSDVFAGESKSIHSADTTLVSSHIDNESFSCVAQNAQPSTSTPVTRVSVEIPHSGVSLLTQRRDTLVTVTSPSKKQKVCSYPEEQALNTASFERSMYLSNTHVHRTRDLVIYTSAEFHRIQLALWKSKCIKSVAHDVDTIPDSSLGVFGEDETVVNKDTYMTPDAALVPDVIATQPTAQTIMRNLCGDICSLDSEKFKLPAFVAQSKKTKTLSTRSQSVSYSPSPEEKGTYRKKSLTSADISKHIVHSITHNVCDFLNPCEACILLQQARQQEILEAAIPRQMWSLCMEASILFESICVTSAARLIMYHALNMESERVTICHDRYARLLLSMQLTDSKKDVLKSVIQEFRTRSEQAADTEALITSKEQLVSLDMRALLAARDYVQPLYTDATARKSIDSLIAHAMALAAKHTITLDLSRELKHANIDARFAALQSDNSHAKAMDTDKSAMRQSIVQVIRQIQHIRQQYRASGVAFIGDRICKQPLAYLHTCFSTQEVAYATVELQHVLPITIFNSIMIRMKVTALYMRRAVPFKISIGHNCFMRSFDCVRNETIGTCSTQEVVALVPSGSTELRETIEAHHTYATILKEWFLQQSDHDGVMKADEYLQHIGHMMELKLSSRTTTTAESEVHMSYYGITQHLQFVYKFQQLNMLRRKPTYLHCTHEDIMKQCVVYNAADLSMGRIFYIVNEIITLARKETLHSFCIIFRALFSCDEVQVLAQNIVLMDDILAKNAQTLVTSLQTHKLFNLYNMCDYEANYCADMQNISDGCPMCALLHAGHYNIDGTDRCLSTQCLSLALQSMQLLFKNVTKRVKLIDIIQETINSGLPFAYVMAQAILSKIEITVLPHDQYSALEQRIVRLMQSS